MDKNDETALKTIEGCKAQNVLWLLTIPLDFSIVVTIFSANILQWEIRDYQHRPEEIGSTEVTRNDIIFVSIIFAVLAVFTVFLMISWIKTLRKCRNKLSSFLISLLLSAVIYPMSVFIIFAIF